MGDGEGTADAFASIEEHLAAVRAGRPSVALVVGLSPKGARTLQQILLAARRVFIRDGHAGLSLRKVADEAGVALGNVNYYFASKRELLDATLREALIDYVEAHIAHLNKKCDAPIEILLDVIEFYIENGRSSHPLFFQMWGYAACDPEAKALIRDLYRPIGRFIFLLVRAARPDASETRAREIVLQLFSLEEGVKLFVGMGPDDDRALMSAENHVRTLARTLILAG